MKENYIADLDGVYTLLMDKDTLERVEEVYLILERALEGDTQALKLTEILKKNKVDLGGILAPTVLKTLIATQNLKDIKDINEFIRGIHTNLNIDTSTFNTPLGVDSSKIKHSLDSVYKAIQDNIDEVVETKETETKETQVRKGTEDIVYKPTDILKSSTEQEGSIERIDTSASNQEDELIDTSDIGEIPDIEEVLTSIMMRNEAVFRTCLELDRPYGMLYDKGLLTYRIHEGTLRYIGGANSGRSVFEQLYNAILKGTGANIIPAPDLRNVPNSKNIEELESNYYTGYIFKYALGLIDDKRYTSWAKFSQALENSIRERFKQFYKKQIFFSNMEKIERVFSNTMLVLSYESGAGIKLRVSLPAVTINIKNLENSIREITTYRSASITITPVKGYNDVVDIQIMLQEDKFLNRPSWAYKAMKLKLDNGERVSLTEGLPIGRMVNGDIVEFKLDPSSRFLNFISAGSGAGKGVLTLSLTASAIGSGVPLFYMDYKPDMAPVFWEYEKQFGINTATYDAMVKHRPSDNSKEHTLGYGIPKEVQGKLGKYAGAIHYLKSVQLMCAMAQYRADRVTSHPIMFIFDETQQIQEVIKDLINETTKLNTQHKPPKGKEGDEVYVYTSKLIEWFIEINSNIGTYINTTGRKSSTFCIFIAQSPDYTTWNSLTAKAGDTTVQMLGKITMANTICKILGKGSTTSKYGLGGDGKKSISEKELKYVTNNRFFAMYDGKTTDGADVKVFKPFLTLNTDNPFDKCWTDGMGRRYGYGSLSKSDYISNIAIEHKGETNFTNQYGIHTGTGLLGLTSMYCGGDLEKVKTGLGSGWKYCIEFFKATGLSSKYSTPTDYMYDMSLDGLLMIHSMVDYKKEEHTSQTPTETPSKELDTGIKVESGLSDRPTSPPVKDEQLEMETQALKAYKNSKEEVDNYINNLIRNTPENADTLNIASHMLKKDIQENNIAPPLAEQVAKELRLVDLGFVDSYDFKNNNILDTGRAVENKPVYIDTLGETAHTTSDRFNSINTDITSNATALNDENSIDCRMGGAFNTGIVDRILLKTFNGSQRYIDNLWKSILNSIINQGYNKATITRVSLYGGHLYINGKIVILDGIIGGRQNIMLRDIVNFKIMFNRFPMIRELRLDETMFRALLLEYKNNVIDTVFKDCPKLDVIYIKMDSGETQKFDRQLGDSSNLESKNRVRNEIDLECKSKSSEKWHERLNTDNIWGMKLAKNCMGSASKQFLDKNKPKLVTGTLLTIGGFIVGTVGLGSWGLFKAGKGLTGLSKKFR